MKKIIFLILLVLPLIGFGTHSPFIVYSGQLENFAHVEIECIDNELHITVSTQGPDGKIREIKDTDIYIDGEKVDLSKSKTIVSDDGKSVKVVTEKIALDDLVDGKVEVKATMKQYRKGTRYE